MRLVDVQVSVTVAHVYSLFDRAAVEPHSYLARLLLVIFNPYTLVWA